MLLACATNEGGAGRPVIAAPFRNAGNPDGVDMKQGTTMKVPHLRFPRPVGRPSLPGSKSILESAGVLGDVTSTLKNSPW